MNNVISASEVAYYNEMQESLKNDRGEIIYAARLLERARKRCPTTPAIIFKDTEINYQELYERACRVSAYLLSRGVKPCDRVILWYGNAPEFYYAYYGVWQIGAIIVPLNTFLHSAELTHIINDCKPYCMIVSDACLATVQEEHRASLPSLVREQELRDILKQPYTLITHHDLTNSEMSVLLYTSGTTGMPKGVMLSSHNILTNLSQGASRIQLRETERLLAVLPLFHSFSQFGHVWGPIFACCTIILLPKIDRHNIVWGFSKYPTIVMGVPALYALFCMLQKLPLDSVRYFISGGDALPDKIAMGFELIYQRKIVTGYGLTECCPLVSAGFDDDLALTSRVGYPVIHLECQIRTEEGNLLTSNKIGIIWVHGDNVMLGYFNAPEETNKVLVDGWLNTGDLGYIDDDGRLYVTGREKDLIINKGINIYPQEIENVIMHYPSVIRVAVVGKIDQYEGEVPVAFVQLRTLEDHIEQILQKLCQEHLAPYKIPRMFICTIDELPTTATGKLDKKVLRKDARIQPRE